MRVVGLLRSLSFDAASTGSGRLKARQSSIGVVRSGSPLAAPTEAPDAWSVPKGEEQHIILEALVTPAKNEFSWNALNRNSYLIVYFFLTLFNGLAWSFSGVNTLSHYIDLPYVTLAGTILLAGLFFFLYGQKYYKASQKARFTLSGGDKATETEKRVSLKRYRHYKIAVTVKGLAARQQKKYGSSSELSVVGKYWIFRYIVCFKQVEGILGLRDEKPIFEVVDKEVGKAEIDSAFLQTTSEMYNTLATIYSKARNGDRLVTASSLKTVIDRYIATQGGETVAENIAQYICRQGKRVSVQELHHYCYLVRQIIRNFAESDPDAFYGIFNGVKRAAMDDETISKSSERRKILSKEIDSIDPLIGQLMDAYFDVNLNSTKLKQKIQSTVTHVFGSRGPDNKADFLKSMNFNGELGGSVKGMQDAAEASYSAKEWEKDGRAFHAMTARSLRLGFIEVFSGCDVRYREKMARIRGPDIAIGKGKQEDESTNAQKETTGRFLQCALLKLGGENDRKSCPSRNQSILLKIADIVGQLNCWANAVLVASLGLYGGLALSKLFGASWIFTHWSIIILGILFAGAGARTSYDFTRNMAKKSCHLISGIILDRGIDNDESYDWSRWYIALMLGLFMGCAATIFNTYNVHASVAHLTLLLGHPAWLVAAEPILTPALTALVFISSAICVTGLYCAVWLERLCGKKLSELESKEETRGESWVAWLKKLFDECFEVPSHDATYRLINIIWPVVGALIMVGSSSLAALAFPWLTPITAHCILFSLLPVVFVTWYLAFRGSLHSFTSLEDITVVDKQPAETIGVPSSYLDSPSPVGSLVSVGSGSAVPVEKTSRFSLSSV